MGIERLTSSLLKEADEEASRIVEAAEGHVRKMKEDERAKVASLKKKAEKERALNKHEDSLQGKAGKQNDQIRKEEGI